MLLFLQSTQLTFSQVAVGIVLTAINASVQGVIYCAAIMLGVKYGIRLGLGKKAGES